MNITAQQSTNQVFQLKQFLDILSNLIEQMFIPGRSCAETALNTGVRSLLKKTLS